MTGRRRSKAERMADHAWNVKVAQRTPNVWIKYMPKMTQGGDTNKELRDHGVQVRSVHGLTEIKFVDEQLDMAPVAPVAPVAPESTACLHCQYYRERLTRALEMVCIKDELITKQFALITYLEGRK